MQLFDSVYQLLKIAHFNLPTCVWSGLCGLMVEHLLVIQKVAGLNISRSASRYSLGQAAHTHVPLSPSSIIWCQPMGGDALQLGR